MVPLLPWLLALVSGLLAAAFPYTESLLPVVFSAAALGGALQHTALNHRGRWLPWVLVVSWFSLGAFLQVDAESPPPVSHVWNRLQPLQRADVEGVIVKPPEVSPGRTRYYIQLERIRYQNTWQPVKGVARLSFFGEGASLVWGDRVRFSHIRLKRPSNFRNPGRFDYERYLRYEGIDVTGGMSRLHSVRRIGHVELALWNRLTFSLRDQFQKGLESLPQNKAALLNAMVLGGRAGLTPKLEEAYVNTGLMHLLAVSGLHVGFVAGVSFWLSYQLWFAVFWKWQRGLARAGWAKKAAALSALIPVLGYMALVGTRVSAVRAGLLVLLFLLAVLINRERSWFNSLFFAAILILLVRPDALWQAGFQLSFLAVLTILCGLEWILTQQTDALESLIEPPWYRRWAVPEWRSSRLHGRVVDIVCASGFFSLCAIAGTFPVLLYQFHQISLIGWVMNLWAVPLASLMIPATLLGLLLDVVWQGLGTLVLVPVSWLATLFIEIPQAVSHWPGIVWHPASPPWPWLIFYGAVLFGGPWWWRQSKSKSFSESQALWITRRIPAGLAVCLGVTLLWLAFPGVTRPATGKLHLWMLDVGQGEAIFMEFPDGRTLVLDAGGYYRDALDVGKVVVGDFLRDRGINRLDFLGATHSDQDHIDGVESLIENFTVAHYLDRAETLGDARLSRLRTRAMIHGANPLLLSRDRPLFIGDVTLRLIHPTPDFLLREGQPFPARIGNDLSSVLRIEYGDFSLLLTGDIQKKSEDWLRESGPLLRARVLKAPHHGSRTSSSGPFLDAVGASDVLISSGRYNVFRHPHPEILARYQERGMNVWRTDEVGALHLETDGTNYHIQSHAGLSRF